MQQLAEAGLINKWERDTRERRAAMGRDKRPASRGADPARFVAISLHHLQGAFILLSAGYAAGLIALVAELVTQRGRKKAAIWRWQRLAKRRRVVANWTGMQHGSPPTHARAGETRNYKHGETRKRNSRLSLHTDVENLLNMSVARNNRSSGIPRQPS